MVSRKAMAELKQLGLEKWQCLGCGRIEFRHPELQQADLDGKRRFCGVECFHKHAAKERAAYEELVKTCACGVKFRCTPSQDWTQCDSCRTVGSRPKVRVDVECPDCGKIRQYTPSGAKKLQTNKCLDCAHKGRTTRVTITCSGCGKKRSMGKYAASKKKSDLCRSCWLSKRTEHAEKDCVTIVCPDCQQSRQIKTNKRGKTDYCETCSKKQYYPPNPTLRSCEICGTETKNQKYCSVQCRHQGLTKTVTKNCEHCGDPFQAHLCKAESHKYCSVACRHEAAKKRVEFTCPVCSTIIEIRKSSANRRLTCSDDCGFIYKTERVAKSQKCPICRKNEIGSKNIICGACSRKSGKNIANWKKAAKRAIVAHGNKKWRFAQKTKVTKEMARIINNHFDEYNFLSMPHIGRELVMLQQITKLQLETSLGVEREKASFVALQAVINRYFDGAMPLIYNDIDKFCIKTKRRFDVAHLDYNGPLTQSHLEAINQLIASGTLTFFTVAQNHRFKDHMNGVVHYDENPPVIGNQILKISYAGSSKIPMEFFGYLK